MADEFTYDDHTAAAISDFASECNVSEQEVLRWGYAGMLIKYVIPVKFAGGEAMVSRVRLPDGITINEARDAAKALDMMGVGLGPVRKKVAARFYGARVADHGVGGDFQIKAQKPWRY